MTSLIWYLILVKMVLCSNSNSSSSSSSSSLDSTEFDTLFDGEYTATDFPGMGFSICTAENGNIYGSGGPLTDYTITSYINTYGRSTEGVVEISDGVYQAEFDVFQFVTPPSTGVNRLSATMTYYENLDATTLSFDGATASNLTKTSDTATRCLIPDANWNDVNEDDVPLNVASFDLPSALCPIGISNCVAILRFENALVDGGACWGYYDADNNVFVGGGDLSINTQIMWDGELRIAEWDDANPLGCSPGTLFNVWTNEEEELIASYHCAPANVGALVRFSTDRDVLEEIEGDTCPLYVPSINAKTVFRNDDEYHENGNKVERIVINFSNTTIGMLWAIVIVFILVTVGMCWWVKGKSVKIEQNFDI